MAELAAITQGLDFHLEQLQDFTPTPMTVSTEAWHTGFDPYTLQPVFSAKSPKDKLAQRQFFFWYKPEERRNIERTLRMMGREDLIAKLGIRNEKSEVRNEKSEFRNEGNRKANNRKESKEKARGRNRRNR